MKHISLITIFFLGFMAQAQAPIGFYLSGGVTQTSLKSDDLLADPGMGFKIGSIFNMGYHQSYNYQVEVFFGLGSLDLLAVDENYESKENSKYAYSTTDIGFYFNYYIIKPEEGKFYMGPQIGTTFTFAPQLTETESTNNEYYLPHLMSDGELMTLPDINYSAGFGLTGGYNDFRFDLRYSLGLNNMLRDFQTNSYNQNGLYTGPSAEGKINTISFTVSYSVWKLMGVAE
jgi:hypothetical protein